ncbi:MAG: hypothetical protein ABJC24_06790 [Chloroflexota bacterium]
MNGLMVRAQRGTQAPVLDDVYGLYDAGGKVRLAAGDHVLVISNAVWADGHWWLEIATDRVGSISIQPPGSRRPDLPPKAHRIRR